MSTSPRRRGRPPSVDSAAAMPAVVELFRAKGYAAVSLDDLADATGLSRPSLYRAFGDKLSMYMAAIDAFGEQVSASAVPALMQDGEFDVALSSFYVEMLRIYYRDPAVAAGCLVFGTAPSSADLPAVRTRLLESVNALDAAMRSRVRRSYPGVGDETVALAAKMASNTLFAFSIRAKSGSAQQELVEIGQGTARSIAAMLDQAG